MASKDQNEARPKFKWLIWISDLIDPRIDLGHIITILMIVVFLFKFLSALDERVSVLEDARLMQRNLYGARVTQIDARLKNVETDVREVRQRVDQLSDQKGK